MAPKASDEVAAQLPKKAPRRWVRTTCSSSSRRKAAAEVAEQAREAFAALLATPEVQGCLAVPFVTAFASPRVWRCT